MKEIYAWPIQDGDKPLQVIGLIAAKESLDAAQDCARELAAKFDAHGFEGEARYVYFWGHDKEAPQSARFVIRPVMPSAN
jgi:hypothetical protein